MFKFNLQMFANENNPNMNVQVTTMNSVGNDLSPQMKEFYDTQLLENVREDHYFNQFGQRQPLPKGNGDTVEWRKIDTFDPATKPLTEGVTPDGHSINYTKVKAKIEQFGDYVTLSDRLQMEAIDPVISNVTEESAAQAADTLEIITRDAVTAGTNVMYGGSKTSRHTLEKTDVLTATMVNKIDTFLKKMKAPKINGSYVCVIHPDVAEDLRESQAWLEAHKYSATTEIFNGEIGKLHNIRFVESTECKVYYGADLASDARNLKVSSVSNNVVTFTGGTVAADSLVGRYVLLDNKYYVAANDTTTMTLMDAVAHTTAATLTGVSANDVIYPGEGGKAGIATYGLVAFGKDAYGRVEPTAESLQMLVKQLGAGGTSDPLNQRSTVGWKASHAAKILYQERILRIEVGSSYSDVVTEGN